MNRFISTIRRFTWREVETPERKERTSTPVLNLWHHKIGGAYVGIVPLLSCCLRYSSWAKVASVWLGGGFLPDAPLRSSQDPLLRRNDPNLPYNLITKSDRGGAISHKAYGINICRDKTWKNDRQEVFLNLKIDLFHVRIGFCNKTMGYQTST